MGLIRWDRVGGDRHYVIFGDLGGEHICSIRPHEFPFNGQPVDGFKLVFHDQFPGYNGDRDDRYRDFVSIGLDAAQGVAEAFLQILLLKLRTEADIRSADIDTDRCVTFRDEGAA